jgi:histidine ammonia-lyase
MADPSDAPLALADEHGQPRRLAIPELVSVARFGRSVELLEEDPARHRPLEAGMAASVAWVERQVAAMGGEDPRPVYGINTGFGALAGRQAFRSPYHARVLSRNLLISHACGVGPPLDEEVVRAAALIRVNQLAQGRSGLRVVVANRLLQLLNARIYPRVPALGSLGASGDLAPLAHLALVVSRAPSPPAGETPLPVSAWAGEAWIPAPPGDPEPAGEAGDGPALHLTQDFLTGRAERWRLVGGPEAMARVGGQLELEAKEGLALVNGATMSAALAALAVADARRLLDHAELAAAMTLEAARGFRDAFLPEVQAARPHPGAAVVAARVLAYVAGSSLLDAADRDSDPQRVPPQDPYSLRCVPQVLGAGRDVVGFAERTVTIEINSAVDNPLILLELPRAYKTVSNGSFHGAPLGYALDLLKVVLTDCASLAERRVFLLMDYRFDDPARRELSLPRFLMPSTDGLEGINSGLMLPQYTAAALVSAAKTLAHPDSVDSIPSSANQEDHVSMSMNAGLHLRRIVTLAEHVLAIELLAAAQALDLRARQGSGSPGHGVAAALGRLRATVPALTFDRPPAPDVAAVVGLMRAEALLAAARQAAPEPAGIGWAAVAEP